MVVDDPHNESKTRKLVHRYVLPASHVCLCTSRIKNESRGRYIKPTVFFVTDTLSMKQAAVDHYGELMIATGV